MVANELKYRAPKAHTMLELVYVRWGPTAHIIYFFFAVLTNLLVSLSMLQGMRHAAARVSCLHLTALFPQARRCSPTADGRRYCFRPFLAMETA